jgi:hypothetical protein
MRRTTTMTTLLSVLLLDRDDFSKNGSLDIRRNRSQLDARSRAAVLTMRRAIEKNLHFHRDRIARDMRSARPKMRLTI